MKNAISGLGLPPESAMITFPIELFLPGSDIAAIEARKREFYNALTKWQPEQAAAAGGELPLLTVEGDDYEQALDRANDLMITNLWGDGLPLRPATPARVERILRGTALPRTHVIGKFPPRGGVTTVETCAIALAMAGGRAEYLPVLIAAVEAFLQPDVNAEQLQAASGGAYPVVICLLTSGDWFLTGLGLDIVLSKISTKADQVADVFYLMDGEGKKIVLPERLEEIRGVARRVD